jgi:glucose-1-phosphate cytidylyltransferase
MKSDIVNYIEDDTTSLEKEPMEILSKNKQLSVYKHSGYFQPVDTIREKEIVEKYLKNNKND